MAKVSSPLREGGPPPLHSGLVKLMYHENASCFFRPVCPSASKVPLRRPTCFMVNPPPFSLPFSFWVECPQLHKLGTPLPPQKFGSGGVAIGFRWDGFQVILQEEGGWQAIAVWQPPPPPPPGSDAKNKCEHLNWPPILGPFHFHFFCGNFLMWVYGWMVRLGSPPPLARHEWCRAQKILLQCTTSKSHIGELAPMAFCDIRVAGCGEHLPAWGLRDDRIPGTDQAVRGGRHGQKLHSGFPPRQVDARRSMDACLS